MEQLTSQQISEWEAYDRIDPIGTWRLDYQTAALSSLITNIVRTLFPKEGTTEIEYTSPSDFMPPWDPLEAEMKRQREKQPKQTVEDMLAVMMTVAKNQNKAMEQKKRQHPPTKKRR